MLAPVAYFAAVNGRWPSAASLRRFAEACGVGVENLTGALESHRRDAARMLNDAGLPVPSGTPRRGAGARMITYAPVGGLPGARRRTDNPDALRERAIAGLQVWLRDTATAGRHRHSDYQHWSVGTGWLTYGTIVKRGGFAALRAEARRRNTAGIDPDPRSLMTPLAAPSDADELRWSLRAAAEAPKEPIDERRSRHVVSLAMLIDSGALAAGERLLLRAGGHEHFATVTSEGGILLDDGRLAETPATAVRMVLGHSEDGFRRWRVHRGGRWVTLATLVESLRAQLQRNKPPRMVGIKPLLDAGLLHAGEPLLMRLREREEHATVMGDGQIDVPGHGRFANLSAALGPFAGAEGSGWTRWRVLRDGKWVTVGEIRDQLPEPALDTPRMSGREATRRARENGSRPGQSRADDVIDHLARTGAASAIEIAAALGMSYGGAIACLNRLTTAGRLTAAAPATGERAKRWKLAGN